jgi:thiamine transport system ATP-binding protein
MVTHDHEEAFTIADRLAVMRAGEIVQQGAIDEVWRAPVDAQTALFLGYARVLEGAAAEKVQRGAVRLAVRRSAFRVDPSGELNGRVTEARVTPEQVRLVVGVDGVGELDAVAPLDEHPGVGEPVRLSVDVTRTAPVGR